MLLGLIAEEMNDPHTMLAEDVEADEHELRINGCYDQWRLQKFYPGCSYFTLKKF